MLASMDIATTNETLPTPIGPVAEGIASRIATERDRLAAEEAAERDLIARRKSILANGDDAEIDKIENGIGTSRSKQLRMIERLDLLGEQLLKANADATSGELDAIAARAERTRQAGERLIEVKYPKVALAMAKILGELALIDEALDRDNRALDAAGRKTVPKPNQVRCRLTVRIESSERMQLGLGDSRHPLHHEVEPSIGGDVWYRKGTRERVPTFGDFDVPVVKTIQGDWPAPLWEAITLPPSEAQPLPHPDTKARIAPIWNSRSFKATTEDIAQLHADLSKEPK